MMRYEIIDSHRKMSPGRKRALMEFFREVKQVLEEEAWKQVDFCTWYETEYAVKWFEVIAFDGSIPVGYLRCFRNPKDEKQWYIGDVHVRNGYKHQGIATKMYGKTFKELERYEATENVISAVRKDNEKSKGLHKKMGFVDTGETCEFASFFVDENETKYRKMLYRYLPLPEELKVDEAVRIMLPVWQSCAKESEKRKSKKKLKEELESLIRGALSGEDSLETIWCGNRLVGLRHNMVSITENS